LLGTYCEITSQPSAGIGSITTQFTVDGRDMPAQSPCHVEHWYLSIAPARNLVALTKAEL
jgi:hypothetical protein